MRRFRITFKNWDKEIRSMEFIIDMDLGPEHFPDMMGTIIKEMTYDYDIEELLEIKNIGQPTYEEYQLWLETEDGKYFMSL